MKIKQVAATLLILLLLPLVASAQEKKIWQEPSFYLSQSAQWADVIVSYNVADGRRLKETNFLFAKHGKVNLPLAVGANAASTALTWLAYEKSPKWGRRIMWGVAAFRGILVVRSLSLNRSK